MPADAFSTIRQEAKQTQVLVFAGGMGKRMASDVPKALLAPSGQPLIDRCITLFTNCGFKDFVFLLGYGHEKITRHLEKGGRRRINATYSIDPKRDYGRGPSLLHALEDDKVDRERRGFVVFPDDIFTDNFMPLKVLSQHLYGVRSHAILASLVLTSGRNWPYGVAEVDEKDIITAFTEKPFIQRPTSVGSYVFEPRVYEMLEEATEIERQLIPRLSALRKLYAIFIPPESWLPVNTLKDFEEAQSVLSGTPVSRKED